MSHPRRAQHRLPAPSRHFARALFLGVLAASAAWAASPETVAAIDRQLAETYPADRPGAAVIVVEHGETLLRKGYGLANAELGVAIEPEMTFRLGSITKQFTAVAVLMLAEQGKVDLSAPITTYLPDFPTQGKTITVEQLLQHTSGLKNYTELSEWAPRWREDMTVQQIIDLFKDKPLDFAPGTSWHYSNSGYILLGAIVEKVSGQSYADFLREHVLAPLGLEHTYYDDPRRLVPGRVAGYEADGKGVRPADYLSMTQPYAAGALASNVDDLARWTAALGAGSVLTAASRQRLWTGGQIADGRSTHYAYGWGAWSYEGHRVIEHGGGIHGFSTGALWLPDDGVFVAVLSNLPGASDPEAVALQAASQLIGLPLAQRAFVTLPPAALERYVGVYQVGDNPQDVRVVRHEGDHLTSQRSGSEKFVLRARNDRDFFFEGSTTAARFEIDAAGKVTGMTIIRTVGLDESSARTDRPLPAERQEMKVDPAALPGLVGNYELAPGFVLAVTLDGDQLYAQATGQPRFEIYPESEKRFFLKVVEAVIEFGERDADGKAKSLILFQGGQVIPGKRVP